MSAVRCLLVDDDQFLREGLALGLRGRDDVELAATVGSLEEALACGERVDVVLLDLGLPDVCRRSATRTVLEEWPHVRVLIVTAHATGPDVVQAFAEGACGYVTKNVAPEELAHAVRKVAAGSSYVTPSLAGHLLNAGFELTPKERAILRLVAEGMSDKEVAQTLQVAEKTVENRLGAIRAKAGLLNRPRSALTRFAYEVDLGCGLRAEGHDETDRKPARPARRGLRGRRTGRDGGGR